MAEASAEITTAAVIGDNKKGKKAASGAKKPKAKPTHPPTSEMVTNAIKSLKERGGSSLPAIKKYLAANYKVDTEKLAPFIKKYLKGAVSGGTLIQTKGKGASGSFKLSKSAANVKPKAKSGEEKKKKAVTTKKASEKKLKAKKEKSAEAKKKSVSTTKKAEKKKVTKAAVKSVKKSGEIKSKTPKQKPTKPSKAAAKSPKAPKPKKATASVKKAAAATKKPTRK